MYEKNFIESNKTELLALTWLYHQKFDIPPTPEEIQQMYYDACKRIDDDLRRKQYIR